MSIDVEDVEFVLAENDLRARVSPYGASLRGLWREAPSGTRQYIVTGYSGAGSKVAGEGDVLIPFPGRVKGGRYTFEGQSYQMEINDKDGGNAIHGFLRHVPWKVAERSQTSATFTVLLNSADYPGYPFTLSVWLTYLVQSSGLTCSLVIQNTGDRTAPVAAGFHPYFTVNSDVIDADILQVPMAGTLEFENLVPTGRILPVDGTALDFRRPRAIGDVRIDNCFANPIRDADSILRVHLVAPDNRNAITVWMDAAFDYVVLYTADPQPESHRRRALAIEPMTCGSDAFNHPEWGLLTLFPHQSCTASWGVDVFG